MIRKKWSFVKTHAQPRSDRLYTLSTGRSHDFNAHFGVNIGFAANPGRNEQDGIPNANYREFDAYLTSIKIYSKF